MISLEKTSPAPWTPLFLLYGSFFYRARRVERVHASFVDCLRLRQPAMDMYTFHGALGAVTALVVIVPIDAQAPPTYDHHCASQP